MRGWHFGLLAAGTFAVGMDGFVLSGLLPDIAGDLSVSVSTAGQLTTIFSVTYAVGSPVIATLTGRWDRRVLLGGGLLFFLLGIAGQAVATTFAVMALSRVVAALGAAAFQSNAYVMAGLLAGPERRGRALAAVTAGTSLSMVVGVPFGVLIGQWWSWRVALWTITALAVLTAVAVPGLPSAHVPPTSMRTRLSVLTRPAVLAVLVTSVAVLAPTFLVISYLPVVLDIPNTGARLVVVLLAFGLGGVIGNRLVGRLVDTRGAVPVLVIAVSGLAVSYLALAPLRSWYVPTLVVVLVIGAFGGLAITPQQHRLFTLVPDVATVALGLNGSAIYAGAALGAALGGVVLSATSASSLPVAAAVLSAAALALIVATAPERRSAGPPSSSAAPYKSTALPGA